MITSRPSVEQAHKQLPLPNVPKVNREEDSGDTIKGERPTGLGGKGIN